MRPWSVEECAAYAKQLRDKSRASTAEHAAEAIEYLLELVKPQQEPVASAWWALVMGAAAEIEDASNCLRDKDAKRKALGGAKHYRDAANALYTAPQRREWVGLTEQECIDAIDEYFDFALDHGNVSNTSVVRYARAIESLLKEKNQ